MTPLEKKSLAHVEKLISDLKNSLSEIKDYAFFSFEKVAKEPESLKKVRDELFANTTKHRDTIDEIDEWIKNIKG